MLPDSEIREPVFRFFEQRSEKLRIIEEKNIGRSRADFLIILPEEIIGCEIKSDCDSYSRLASQIKSYGHYCDRCFLIVGLSHIKSAPSHVPEQWGLISTVKRNGTVQVNVEREALPNKNDRFRFSRQLSLLWKNELSEILAENSMPKYASKSRKFIITKLLEKVAPELLKKQLCNRLFERDYTVFGDTD